MDEYLELLARTRASELELAEMKLQRQRAELEDKMKGMGMQYRDDMEKMGNKIRSLEGLLEKNCRYGKMTTEKAKQLDLALEENENLKYELGSLKNKQIAELDALNRKIKELEGENLFLKDETNCKEIENNNFPSDYVNLKGKIKSLERQSKEAERRAELEIKAAIEREKEARKSLEKVEQEKKGIAMEMKKMVEERESSERLLSKLKLEVGIKDERIAMLESNLKQKDNTIDILKGLVGRTDKGTPNTVVGPEIGGVTKVPKKRGRKRKAEKTQAMGKKSGPPRSVVEPSIDGDISAAGSSSVMVDEVVLQEDSSSVSVKEDHQLVCVPVKKRKRGRPVGSRTKEVKEEVVDVERRVDKKARRDDENNVNIEDKKSEKIRGASPPKRAPTSFFAGQISFSSDSPSFGKNH